MYVSMLGFTFKKVFSFLRSSVQNVLYTLDSLHARTCPSEYYAKVFEIKVIFSSFFLEPLPLQFGSLSFLEVSPFHFCSFFSLKIFYSCVLMQEAASGEQPG